jgi:hypothetical protein
MKTTLESSFVQEPELHGPWRLHLCKNKKDLLKISLFIEETSGEGTKLKILIQNIQYR